MKRAFIPIGHKILAFFDELGQITILTGQLIKRLFTEPFPMRRSLDQILQLGIASLPVTVITAVFVGMAFTIQVVREFLRFGAGDMVGGVVGLAIWRELGPLLTGVVVAGRVGAAISAEIGTMKVTEQIEALEAMSQDPVHYLVVPRVVACTYMLPLLVGIADIVGFLGGFVVAIASGRINPYAYFSSAQSMLHTIDIAGGLIKAVFFGFTIALLSSYMGLNAKAGAKGVGEVTTKAVVISLITVFILNYFLSLVTR
ncbi:MAG: MlaE family ABC transporter permease [Candidatus Margulisiibacteriota bacterium]